ncbi:MAG: 50S ribosomal protein L19 [Candidatus Magasanikiibacteriota bacterium]
MSEDIRLSLKTGMIVKVHQKIKETNAKGEEKERIQVFEGIIIGNKHGKEAGATVTVRKISNGVGVEKIFPIHSPVVAKIELVREMKVRSAKAAFLRTSKKKLKEVKKDASGKVKIEKVENIVAKVEKTEEIEPMEVVEEVKE